MRRLLLPQAAAREDPHLVAKSFVGVASYLFGAAAAWWSVYLAFALYALTPLFFIVPPERTPERGETIVNDAE